MSRADRVYLFITIFLLIAAIAGGIMLGMQRSRNQPVEIVLSQTEPPEQAGELYVDGAVANPGIYPWQDDDTLQTLLSDVGVEAEADLSRIEIYIPREGEEQSPQKIDINRAEPWLLEALPGIGETLAQRIIDYRGTNGPFKRIEDLLKVSGIGLATFENMKDLITVSD
ncbi:MAG: helix-hairpin-helix domain-containing protein [Dehalococcoidia bacterium]|nr:helix-hairpin-helix domain-containing protein [Dehalococcoidia bacterium]MDH4299302.1 helix-hairpin-helix domain-containing protein [Dehalococcoidia bacterium]MDH4367366.1 helix-hairpin-helix domain-containing protein [Dehalococcoidia bacterium]